MTNEQAFTSAEWHRKCAVDLFNRVWTLLDTVNRTDEEAETMLHAAHASRYHWGIVGTAVNRARGEWQVSRVYAVLGRTEPALHHAQRCLAICRENEIGDFDIAFAWEALARAYAIAGNAVEQASALRKAEGAGAAIAEEDDRDYFFAELATIPAIETAKRRAVVKSA